MEGGEGEIRVSITVKEKRAMEGRELLEGGFLYRQVVRPAFGTSDEQKVSRFD